MYRKMLVPLDGSELAEEVLAYAEELAGRLDIDIVLLHVATPASGQFAPMYRAYVGQAARILKRKAREIQEKTGMPLGAKPVEVRGELTEGYPPEEILHYADKNAIDLILMATHGGSGIKRWNMGNVADKVLRASQPPIWLVRAGAPDETPYSKWPKHTILVPLDGLEPAESVLPHVEALAKQRNGDLMEVVLLRVCEPPTLPSYYGPELSEASLSWGDYVQLGIAKAKQVANEYLAGIEKRFKDGNFKVQSEVLEGNAPDAIVEYAKKYPFSVIAMATHGRAGLSRWVYGSVAEYVVRGVSNPVLLTRIH